MKKVVFAITSLQLGGAERVLVDIVNRLKEKYEITIFTLYGNGEFIKQLDPKIHYISYYEERFEEIKKSKKNILSCKLLFSFFRKSIYKKYIKGKFDVEVAFLEGPVTWILGCKSNVKKIAWIHNDLEKVYGKDFKNKWKHHLNQCAYPNFEKLIFVSRDNKKAFDHRYPSIVVPKKIIYNYIEKSRILKLAEEKIEVPYQKDGKVFCTVCRLAPQKALERLIAVHQKLIHDGYYHRIFEVGDGPLKLKLLNLIQEKKVEETFQLLGKKENPYPFIQKADYFMLASYYEGYPMVLLEAKVLNKKILITDTASREVLEDYDDKIIMKNNEEGIYQGIKKALTMKEKKKKDSTFSNEEILCDIIDVIEK